MPWDVFAMLCDVYVYALRNWNKSEIQGQIKWHAIIKYVLLEDSSK